MTKQFVQAISVWLLIGFVVGLVSDFAGTTILCRPSYTIKPTWFVIGIVDHALPDAIIGGLAGVIFTLLLMIFVKRRHNYKLVPSTWVLAAALGIVVMAVELLLIINSQVDNCVL